MPSVLWSYHTRVPSSRHPTFIFGFDLPNCTPVCIPVYIKFVLGCNCFSSIGLEGDEGNTLWGKNQLQDTQCMWYDDTTFISSYPELEIAEPTGYMVNSWKDVWYRCHVVLFMIHDYLWFPSNGLFYRRSSCNAHFWMFTCSQSQVSWND